MNACLYENSVSSTISIKALVDAFNKEVMLVAALCEYCENYRDILLTLLISVQITESRGNAVGGGVAGNSKLQPGHSTAQHWLQGISSSIINQTVAVAVGSGDGSHHRGSYGGCVARLQVAIVMSGQYHLTIVCTGLDGHSQNNLPLTSTSIRATKKGSRRFHFCFHYRVTMQNGQLNEV